MCYLPQSEMDPVPPRRVQQPDPTTAKHQVLNIPVGISQSKMGQLTSFPSTDAYFGVLLKACYALSNRLDDLETQRSFLEWVGLVAEMKLLRAFFSLQLPTVIAVWENSLDASYRFQHGKAFATLIEIGLTVDNGRLIRSRHAMYFALAVDLGSSNAMGTVSRLMKAGVSPNSRFDRSSLSLIPEKGTYGDELDHYRRCCALKQAAKNRDSEMLKLLITAGNCRCGKFDATYGNVLLCMVATSDPKTGRPPSLQCVRVITDAGMKVDFLPGAPETMEFTTKSLGWHSCGKPELLLDRVFFSPTGAKRDIYEAVASKSQWAQESVTVSGIFLAAEVGPEQIKKYLESATIPQPAAKEALLPIALSEAADREDVPVLVCLLRYGVEPNVSALMAGLSDEDRFLWNPVVRASTRWNIEALRILLNHGVDVGRYPLFRRVMQKSVTPGSNYSHLEKRRSLTIQLLLEAGAPIDIPAASLTLAALVPLRPYYPEGGSVLINEHIRQWLDHIQSFEPDYALCDKLRQHGITFDREVVGCNTLQTVLREGCNRSTVSYLIHSGVQVPSFLSESFNINFGETTMLHDALLMAHVDRLEIVHLLLRSGADIYATTSSGMSILEASLRKANLNIPYHMQRTKENQQVSMSIYRELSILMGRTNFSRVVFTRQSLLSYLIELEESDDSICAELDASGDDNNAVLAGLSPLMHAIMHHRTTLLMRLVERGCDVNLSLDSFPPQLQANPPQFNNALQLACYYERGNCEGFSCVRYLLGKGAKANEPPAMCGVTALQSAAFGGNLGAVTTLLEHGADVNAKPGSQFSWILSSSEMVTSRHQAVDIAASVGHLDMVHLLVKAGGLSGNAGITGLDGAIVAADRNGFTSIVEYLEQHTEHHLSEVMYQAKRVPSSWIR